MAIKIVIAIANCFYIYAMLIVVRCLLTWLPVNWNNPVLKLLQEGADVYLNLFKKFIPPIGPFDLSPMVALFVLFFLQKAIIYIAAIIFNAMGIMG